MFVEAWPHAPDLCEAARRLEGRPGLVWLDGDGLTAGQGRFSFLGSDPVEVCTSVMGDPEPLAPLTRLQGVRSEPSTTSHESSVWNARTPRWVGYIAYDAAWSAPRRRVPIHSRTEGEPVLWFGRYDALLAHDHQTGETVLIGDDPEAAKVLRDRLEGAILAPEPAVVGHASAPPESRHHAAILQALEHIAAGDIYQVNLARSWRVPFHGSPLRVWEQMRQTSPVPFGLFLNPGDHAVLARTMERFLDWEGGTGRLITRPIKGTIARRGGQDREEAERLQADPKERAEHAMIVDLMRNDLGRVAEVGTVEVEEALRVEPYRGLSHLVSTVACRTRAEIGLREILEATFPPGSVTGAPKERAIEIIETLEDGPRGIYTGCVGYIDRTGGASFAVAIRTAVIRGGEIDYQAGGGLVEASRPHKEIAETELKAKTFLDAVAALRSSEEKSENDSPITETRDM